MRTDTFTNKSGYLSILVEGGRVDVQGRGFYGEGKNTYLNVRLHRIDLDFNERDRPCFVLHPNNLVIRYLAYSCFSQSLSGTTLFIHQSRVDRKYPAREIYLYIPWLFSKYHTQLLQCCFLSQFNPNVYAKRSNIVSLLNSPIFPLFFSFTYPLNSKSS